MPVDPGRDVPILRGVVPVPSAVGEFAGPPPRPRAVAMLALGALQVAFDVHGARVRCSVCPTKVVVARHVALAIGVHPPLAVDAVPFRGGVGPSVERRLCEGFAPVGDLAQRGGGHQERNQKMLHRHKKQEHGAPSSSNGRQTGRRCKVIVQK